MIALAFRFTAGAYHATPWGHHVNEGLIDRDEAVRRITPDQLRQLKSVARLREGTMPVGSGVAA